MALFAGIMCEVCGKQTVFFDHCTKGDLVRYARNLGWKLGKRHICPDCANKRKSGLE